MKALACTLHIANSKVFDRDGFYPLKDAILKQYGMQVGFDYQKIQAECWSCGGTGSYWNNGDCCKCYGTGVYYTRLVRLERWTLGGRTFHSKPTRVPMDHAAPTIHGLVNHRKTRCSMLAAIALARVFDANLYWTWLQSSNDARFGWYVRRSEQIARAVAMEALGRFTERLPVVDLLPYQDAPF